MSRTQMAITQQKVKIKQEVRHMKSLPPLSLISENLSCRILSPTHSHHPLWNPFQEMTQRMWEGSILLALSTPAQWKQALDENT